MLALGILIGLLVGGAGGFLLCAVTTISETTELLERVAELEGTWRG